MRQTHQPASQGLSPSRTFAIATAVCVHVGALLLILSPARPEAQAQNRSVSAMEVIEVSPPIPPPPPPPEIPVVRPPQAPTPVIQRPAAPPPPIPLDVVCAECSLAEPQPMRPEPMDTSTEQTSGIDSFSDAHADAAYGSLHHVRYPSSAIRRREQGEVQLRLLISTHGKVLQSEVLRSSGSTILDRSAREAVLDWRFVAAEKNGNAIEAWVIVPIRFNLGSI